MKAKSTCLLALSGLMTLGSLPAGAQESAPPQPDTTKPPPPAHQPTRDHDRKHSPRGMAGDREEVPTAFIGVLTGPVPRELRTHFSIPEGFGLLVEEVMPDSPAKAAGLKEDDVLIRFEDQKLVNMEQLQTLVRSKKKGDTVSLTALSGGRENQISVTIGERMMPAQAGGLQSDRFGPMGEGWFRGDPERSRIVRDYVERMQEQMRDYQNHMREWRRENGRQPMPDSPSRPRSERRVEPPSPPRGPDSRREEPGRSDRSPRPGSREVAEAAAAHVTRSDDSGIYILRRENGRSLFTAKPKEGPEQSWNLESEQERNSIPEPLKEKLKQLEEIRGMGVPAPAGNPAQPPAEGKPKDGI